MTNKMPVRKYQSLPNITPIRNLDEAESPMDIDSTDHSASILNEFPSSNTKLNSKSKPNIYVNIKSLEHRRIEKEREYFERRRRECDSYCDTNERAFHVTVKSKELTDLIHVIDEVMKYPKCTVATANYIYYNRWLEFGIMVGTYPRPGSCTVMNENITTIINLCTDSEISERGDYRQEWQQLRPNTKILNYPIAPGTAPNHLDLAMFIQKVVMVNASKIGIIYIHSATGHGRANLVGAYLYGLCFREYNVYKLYERIRAGYYRDRGSGIRIGNPGWLDNWEQFKCLEYIRTFQGMFNIERSMSI